MKIPEMESLASLQSSRTVKKCKLDGGFWIFMAQRIVLFEWEIPVIVMISCQFYYCHVGLVLNCKDTRVNRSKLLRRVGVGWCLRDSLDGNRDARERGASVELEAKNFIPIGQDILYRNSLTLKSSEPYWVKIFPEEFQLLYLTICE